MADSQLQQIWQQALARYKADTRSDLNDRSLPHPETVEDLIAILQRRHADFDKETGRGKDFSKYLRLAVGPFNFLQNMFGGMAGAAFPPSSQILGAVSVLVQAGKNVTGSFDAVSALFEKLSAFMSRFQALSAVQIDHELARILAQIMAAMLKVLGLATKRTHTQVDDDDSKIKHRHLEKIKRTVQTNVGEYLRQLFLGKDEEIEAAVDALKNLIEEEHLMTTALVKKDTTMLKNDTAVLKGDTTTLKSEATFAHNKLSVIEASMKESRAADGELLALVRGLNSAKPPPKVTSSQKSSNEKSEYLSRRLQPLDSASTELERMHRERVPGTLEKVATDPSVTQWIERKLPVLQLASGVGTGKSFFASRVVELLSESKHDAHDIGRHSIGHHFWKQRSAAPKSVAQLLRTLAYQIARSDEAYKEHLVRELRKPNGDEETVRFWWKILFEVYFSKARAWAFVVIEGLDDADEDERDSLLQCFQDLLSAHNGTWPLQLQCLFCTSVELAERITGIFGQQAARAEWVNTDDLRIFIGRRLGNTWKDMLVDVDLYRDTVTAIVEASQGSFLLASLLVDDVTALSREKDIRDRLLTLPVNLESATPLALSRLERQLDHEDIVDLTDILAWVICSHRNLTLRELDAVLSLRSDEGSRIIDLEARIGGRFASLFVLSNSGSDSGLTHEQISARKRLAEQDFMTCSGQSLPLIFQSDNDESAKRSMLDNLEHSKDVAARLKKKHVRFEHGLIADHIRNDTAINIVAGTRIDQLRVNVLQGCLEVLCGHPEAESSDRKAALSYCGLYLTEHLLDVEVNKVGADAKQSILRHLVRLLTDDVVLNRWIDISGSWLRSDVLLNRDCVVRLCQWVKDEEAQGALDQDSLQWVEAATKHPVKTLFHNLALRQVTLWLSQRTSSGTTYFEFVNTYLTMINQPDEVLPDPIPDLSVNGASVERVFEVARWGKMDETAYWYSRIGYALRNGERWDDAIKFYELATQKDPTDGSPVSAVAIILDGIGKYDDAVERSKLAIELYRKTIGIETEGGRAKVEFTPEEDLLDQHLDLGDYLSHQGNTAAAVDSYKAAYEQWIDPDQNPESFSWDIGARAALACFSVLCSNDQHDEAMRLLEIFNDHPQRFSEPFVQIYTGASTQYLVRLAFETKRLHVLDTFLLNATLSLAHYGTAPQVAAMRYERAVAILRLEPKRQKYALELLEGIAASDDVDQPGTGVYGLRVLNEKTLGSVLLNLILQAREDDRWSMVGQYAEKFKDLIKPGGNEDSELVLAVWERLNGRPHRARDYLMGQIGIGVDMLSDDDPLNDAYAWLYLGNVFLALGDSQRAITCGLAYVHLLLLSTLEYLQQEKQEARQTEAVTKTSVSSTTDNEEAQASEASEIASDALQAGVPTISAQPDAHEPKMSLSDLDESTAYYFCDGPCFKGLKAREPMYRCSYCIQDFCAGCHTLIMSGEETRWNVCSRLHRHVLFPGITEQYPEGKLKVGNEFVDFKVWMEAMQEEYGLEVREPVVPDTKSAAKPQATEIAEQNPASADLEPIESREDTKEGATNETDSERQEELDGRKSENSEITAS